MQLELEDSERHIEVVERLIDKLSREQDQVDHECKVSQRTNHQLKQQVLTSQLSVF